MVIKMFHTGRNFNAGNIRIFVIPNSSIGHYTDSDWRDHLVFQKEIIIGIIYTFGIWGGPLALSGFKTTTVNWVIIAMFGLVAITNLLIFSWYENENDIADNQHSIIQLFGKKATGKIIYYLGAVITLTGLVCIFFANTSIAQIAGIFALVIMQLFLVLVFNKKEFFGVNERYRFYGDIVFVVPLIMLFV